MIPQDSGPAVSGWAARANEAACSVTALFGHRLLFLPGTHIGAILRPSRPAEILVRPWHYWWQAQYLDCLVDAGIREMGSAATSAAPSDGEGPDDGGGKAGVIPGAVEAGAGRLASRLLTGIRLRNLLTFVNSYYDDMAWLALATLRLHELAEATQQEEFRKPPLRNSKRIARIRKTLTLQFDSASTDDLGGGTFWSRKRDFKNTPATAPVALFYARTGQRDKAQALLDWLDARLFDPAQGLYLDGLRIDPAGGVVVETAIYTYNQGPVLGALLELGGKANLARAATIVEAVGRSLTVPPEADRQSGASPDSLVLQCAGTGDGGLFTGILCRYLALAAADQRLSGTVRAAAGRLVLDTAEAFWAGRRHISPTEPLARHLTKHPSGHLSGHVSGHPRKHQGNLIFSVHPRTPADVTYPPGAAVELSTQLQAWMVLEAAAAIQRKTHWK
ncbi:putative alpha-1,6-mannanase (GH76 family) [Arthrobacter pascens]|uniref:glycoside hydrolase family 76 protein n=1 Tax=Arthrobacter pascens TaxID=1677 RepID=UPI002786AB74|nr:glycoside hydrolase family 76 protein [Arthrobacter pascens]MDQ0635498.1 putative alpha-1,6-mannanase (GH76 family) [Arthrobacter pascens]